MINDDMNELTLVVDKLVAQSLGILIHVLCHALDVSCMRRTTEQHNNRVMTSPNDPHKKDKGDNTRYSSNTN